MVRIEPDTELRNFLRNNLTDYNSASRGSAQWIFDDRPRGDLTVSSYPRVVVQKVSANGKLIGCGDNDTWDDVFLQIDVLVHRNLGVLNVTQTDETIGTISNSPRLSFDYLATTVTNIKHNAVAFGTVTAVVNNSDFTAAASLTAGTVQWSRSTGQFNFSSADLTSYSGQSITSTYVENLEGERLAMRIGRDIVEAIRQNWRTDTLIGGLTQPEKIRDPELASFDSEEGNHRVIIEYKFKRFNTGEEV